MHRSPVFEITEGEIPEHPRVLDRWAMSAAGYVTSVQATKIRKSAFGFPSPLKGEETQPPPSQPSPLKGEGVAEPLTRLSLALQQRYARDIGKNSGLPVRCDEAPDGAVAFKIGPVTLINMGPARPVEGRPGLTRRTVRGGALLAKGDEGRGLFEIAVSESGAWIVLEHWLRDYRSPIRGTAARSRTRAWLYRKTQLALHAKVGERFWRGVITI